MPGFSHSSTNLACTSFGTAATFGDFPATLSCWRLVEQLTGGPWYWLFRAIAKTQNASPRNHYVLKVVNPYLEEADAALAIDRLTREALATEQIVHPNVIRLLDAELDRPPFYLVQPWLEGRTLDRLFSRAPHLPLTRLLWVMRQIAEGVRAGHEKGRVFLGLDPSHVFIGRTGRVTLLGWSQSHAFEALTWLPTHQLQTARYLAPECFEKGYRANPAADVYALGVLLHQAMSGRVPFDGVDAEAIRVAHQTEIPADLIFSQPDCPPRLAALTKRMLSKRAAMRPTFSDVLKELINVEIEHLSDHRLISF